MTSTTTTVGVLRPCVAAADCDKPCPPPPAAAAAAGGVNRNHLGPFLIAAVCILGISFLFLTTCTIILRCHFKRRRRRLPDSPTNESSPSSFSASVDHPIWNIVTVGLPQSVIDSITTFKYTNQVQDMTHCSCSVCLADFHDGDCLRLLPNCTHAFHLPCIDTWLRSHQNCPLCRSPILLDHFPTSTITITHTPHLHLHLAPQDDHDDDHDHDHANTINHLERPRFSGINRNSRVLSDLGVYYRFTTLHQHQHQHQHRDTHIPHPITRSFSLNLLPASSIQASASSTTHTCANADGVVDERPKTVENAPKRGTSTSGLGFLMIKSSSIGRSFQKGPVPIKRSLSLGAKFLSFPRTKSHDSILPL